MRRSIQDLHLHQSAQWVVKSNQPDICSSRQWPGLLVQRWRQDISSDLPPRNSGPICLLSELAGHYRSLSMEHSHPSWWHARRQCHCLFISRLEYADSARLGQYYPLVGHKTPLHRGWLEILSGLSSCGSSSAICSEWYIILWLLTHVSTILVVEVWVQALRIDYCEAELGPAHQSLVMHVNSSRHYCGLTLILIGQVWLSEFESFLNYSWSGAVFSVGLIRENNVL